MRAKDLPLSYAKALHDSPAFLCAEFRIGVDGRHQNRRVLVIGSLFAGHAVHVDIDISRESQMVRIVNQDCLAYAKHLLNQDNTDDLCVLNMASAKNPGGGVYGGAGAQEEYLFRCSDYFRFLFQYADPAMFDCEKEYGIPHNPHHSYPLKRNFGGVYSHGVTVFRDTEANGYALLDSPWQVNFVAVAANNIRRFMNGRTTIPDNYIPSTLNLIRTILRIAYNNGQRRFVLGAFGCGAFANPPKHMAQLFKQVFDEPEFQGLFREIHFAIIEDHNSHGRNFNAFKEVFG